MDDEENTYMDTEKNEDEEEKHTTWETGRVRERGEHNNERKKGKIRRKILEKNSSYTTIRCDVQRGAYSVRAYIRGRMAYTTI